MRRVALIGRPRGTSSFGVAAHVYEPERYVTASILVVAALFMAGAVTLTRQPTIPQDAIPAMASTLGHPRKIPPAFALDTIAASPGGENAAGRTHSRLRVGRAQSVSLGGWAYDAVRRKPALGVLFQIDGEVLLLANYGTNRLDVAAHFANPALRTTGFTASIPAGLLAAGRHRLDLIVLEADGEGYYEAGDVAEVTEGR